MTEEERCGKGLCPRMATRRATYNAMSGSVLMLSCDRHGMEPAEDQPNAAEARRYNAEHAAEHDAYDPPRARN